MAATDARSSALLLRPIRRRSGASSKLGAVRRAAAGGAPDEPSAEPLAAERPASSPNHSVASSSSTAATPLTASPAVGAAGRGATADEFARHLCKSGTADRWFTDQITPPGTDTRDPQRHRRQLAVDNAASQIVHKALGGVKQEPGEARQPRSSASKQETGSLMDKGLGAFTGVGKLMEDFALTLDTVIGQAFEEWVPSRATRSSPPDGPAVLQCSTPASRAGAAGGGAAGGGAAGVAVQQAAVAAEHWGDFDLAGGSPQAAEGKENRGARSNAPRDPPRQARLTSFMSKIDAASQQDVHEWRLRAQQLATELQRLRVQQEECQRLQCQVSKLVEENGQLKQRSLPPGADPAIADPLAAQQVTRQMELLLQEKAKLAEENSRLLRENTGLQELLDFTMMHQAELVGDDQLFGDDADAAPLVLEGHPCAALGEPAPPGC